MSGSWQKYLREGIIQNFTQSVVTDSVKANAEFQYEAGLSPKIVRKAAPGCCDWCTSMAGTYDYDKAPSDIYKRHTDCNCTVEYDPGTGRRQNVHTKKWYEADDETLEKRKSVGLEKTSAEELGQRKTIGIHPYYRTANMPPEEFARAKDLWRKCTELNLPNSEKEYVYEELDNNLTAEEKESSIVQRAIGDSIYRAIHLGHNQYKIIYKEPIEKTTGDSFIDAILDEVLTFDWREVL